MSNCLEIVIDARPLCDEQPAGVARFTIEIIRAMLVFDVKLILVSNRKIIKPDFCNSNKIIYIEFTKFKWLPGSLFIFFVLPFLIKLKGKVFWGANHAIPLFGCPRIVTIHDLVSFVYPLSMTLTNRILTRCSILLSLRYADSISTVSEFTKNELLDKFKYLIGKRYVSVIRNSVNRDVFNVCSELNCDTINFPKKFILGVGSIEPRKNLENLVRSYFSLKSSGYEGKLVLVGGRSWKSEVLYKLINSSTYSDEVIFTGYINDKLLNTYYNACDVFVFPSHYEGFGIPALEAILAGANIVCSINTEMPFLFDNCVRQIVWFDPAKDDLTIAIKKCLTLAHQPMTSDSLYWGSWAEGANILFENASRMHTEANGKQ